MKRYFLLFVTLAIVVLQSCYMYGQIKVTGIYSSLEYNDESGDIQGQELIVVLTREGYYIIFQDSEGEPGIPVVVKAKIEKREIEFTLPENRNGFTGKFIGEITDKGIIGEYKKGFVDCYGNKKFVYERKNSFWH